MFFIYTYNQLIKAKVHLGHYKKELNLHNTSNILGIRQNFSLINIKKTFKMLKKIKLLFFNSIYFNKLILLCYITSLNKFIFTIDFMLKFKRYIYCYNKKWTPGFLSNYKYNSLLSPNLDIDVEKTYLFRFPQSIVFFN